MILLNRINRRHILPRLPFSYGWIALIAGTIGVIMSIPGQTMGVSVFTDFLIANLSISRTAVSTTYLIGTIISALLLGRVGKFYDRHGARITAFIAVSALALILVYLSFIDSIKNTVPVTGFIKPGTTAFILLTFGFFNLRFFGQGILAMVSRNMVLKWFDKNRGLIIAIMGGFITFGFSLAPKLFNFLIAAHDWRWAWRTIAAILGLGSIFIVLIFFRDRKADSDNEAVQAAGSKNISENPPQKDNPVDRTLSEALRTREFWSYNIAIAFFALFNTAFTFHIVSIFSDAGIGRSSAVAIFIPISIIAVLSQTAGSVLSDYINLKIILLAELLGMICAAAALIFLAPGLPTALLIGGLGVSNGGFVVLLNMAWIKTFGKTHLGAVSGYAMGWTVGGSALGPFLFSTLRDFSGSYALAAEISIIFLLMLIFFSFARTKTYKK